ncbi:MAG: mechanosensitive ion channel family protein, partial [Chloroflexota bacterium]|nr:mechanosensitive ion channel family protein [Chloroflexota bacterium]
QLQQALRGYLNALGEGPGLFARLLETVAAVVLLVLLQQLAYRLINRNVPEVDRRHQLRVWVRTLTFLLVTFTLIALWLPSGQTLLQVLALLAAGLALTLSRPISSIMAWGVITVQSPFRVGDRIQAGEVMGDVVDIDPLHIHLLEIGNWVDADQSTGRLIHLPNSVIFDGPVYNYTEGFDLIWNELEFVLTHDSDWERARQLLLKEARMIYTEIEPRAVAAADNMARRYAYQRGITTPFVYVKLLRDGIQLSLRYLTQPRRRRGTGHDITTAFLRALRAEPNIKLAAPGYRIVLDEELFPDGDERRATRHEREQEIP